MRGEPEGKAQAERDLDSFLTSLKAVNISSDEIPKSKSYLGDDKSLFPICESDPLPPSWKRVKRRESCWKGMSE